MSKADTTEDKQRKLEQIERKIETTRVEIRKLEAEQKVNHITRNAIHKEVQKGTRGIFTEVTLEQVTWGIWINNNLIRKKIEEDYTLGVRLDQTRKQLNKHNENKVKCG